MFQFCTTTPEDVGIPSAALISFIECLEKQSIPIHSLLMMRHNKLILEAYYVPYQADTLHRMFSITKSFTAIAIGILEKQELLSIDDKISAYFPEYINKDTHPWILSMTIRDLLTMRTCHASTTYKENPEKNWVKSFFTTTPTHPPGKIFHYDTSASHTLAALTEKITKISMLDFLKKQILNQVGFSENSYIMKDPFGNSLGGSGLMSTPMDLLKFGHLINKRGDFKGNQWIRADFLDDAVRKVSATCVTAPCRSEAQGYGYQIWRNEKNGYVCYGMGGQLLICLPAYDMICVTTADTQGLAGGNQAIYDALYNQVIPHIKDVAMAENADDFRRLQQTLHTLTIPPVKSEHGAYPSPYFISGTIYELTENQMGFQSFSLTLAKSSKIGILKYQLNDQQYQLPFGIDHIQQTVFPKYWQKCVISGNWLADQTFYIKVAIIDETVGSLHFQLAFGDGDLTIFIRKQAENTFMEYQNIHLYGKSKVPCV